MCKLILKKNGVSINDGGYFVNGESVATDLPKKFQTPEKVFHIEILEGVEVLETSGVKKTPEGYTIKGRGRISFIIDGIVRKLEIFKKDGVSFIENDFFQNVEERACA